MSECKQCGKPETEEGYQSHNCFQYLKKRVENLEAEKNFDIFVICDAYEAGVGKGLEGKFREGPFTQGSDENEAYRLGFEFGEKKRLDKEQ